MARVLEGTSSLQPDKASSLIPSRQWNSQPPNQITETRSTHLHLSKEKLKLFRTTQSASFAGLLYHRHSSLLWNQQTGCFPLMIFYSTSSPILLMNHPLQQKYRSCHPLLTKDYETDSSFLLVMTLLDLLH